MKRSIIILCVALLLIFTQAFSVSAEEFDDDMLGSISVTLTEPSAQEPIVGAELSVYRVATVVLDDAGTLIYDFTEEFADVSSGVDDPYLVARLEEFLVNNEVDSLKITTDENGTAFCDELPLGLYFVKQTGAVEGFASCTSFLVTVPGEDENGYIYDVNATPKTEVARLTKIIVKKVWNTGAASSAADSVTVQLLQNGQVVKTAELSAENNWQMTFENMPESDAYSIKEVNIPKGFTATYTSSGYTFTVTNTSTLAQTGQLMWPIPTLAICGMLLIALGVILLQKKRKQNA